MAMKLYSDTDVQAIANAIRSKNGSSDTYKISEMAQAITDLPSGGSEPADTIEIVGPVAKTIYGEGVGSFKFYSSDPDYVMTKIGSYEYLIPRQKTLIHSFDLTRGLVDSVDGTSTITLNKNVTRDSSGAHITTNTSYMTIPFIHRPWTTIEVDVSENTLGTLGTHGRFIMFNSSNGFILRNKTNWAFYFNNAWTSTGSSATAPFAGHTVKIVTNASQTMVYLDNTSFYPLKNTHSPTSSTNITIGSSGGQSYCGLVITGIRCYYGFDS